MHADSVRIAPPRRPIRLVLSVADHVEGRWRAICVMPDKDLSVSFAHFPRSGRYSRGAVEPRHFDEGPVAVEAPTVKGAHDSVATHTSPDAEMGTQMRTVSVEDARHSRLVPEQHKVTTQVLQCFDLARSEVRSAGHAEPTIGFRREGVAGGHGSEPS